MQLCRELELRWTALSDIMSTDLEVNIAVNLDLLQ